MSSITTLGSSACGITNASYVLDTTNTVDLSGGFNVALYVLFNTSIANNQKIDGIQVEINAKRSGSFNPTIYLYRQSDGCGSPSVLAGSKTVSLTESMSSVFVGGSTDLWGANELYYDDLFNIKIPAVFHTTITLNYIKITVYYSPASAPTAISNLNGSVNGSQINLSWSKAYDGGTHLTSQKVYRGTSSGNETLYATISTSATSYIDTAPQIGNNYYKILTTNAVGSTFSNEINVIYTPAQHDNATMFGFNF